MEKALGFKDAMFTAALQTKGLKMVMGTDAVAGAHGQNMREILERVTYGRPVLEDGSLGEAAVVNRRFDLRTGEPLDRVSDTEFVDQNSGARLQLS